MTNNEVFRAFALGREGESKTVTSRKAMDGDAVILYSYSTPIAYKMKYQHAIFDERKYSVTTSKQQAQAKRECRGCETIDHQTFRHNVKTMGVSLAGAR